jgi:hypothetical protein
MTEQPNEIPQLFTKNIAQMLLEFPFKKKNSDNPDSNQEPFLETAQKSVAYLIVYFILLAIWVFVFYLHVKYYGQISAERSLFSFFCLLFVPGGMWIALMILHVSLRTPDPKSNAFSPENIQQSGQQFMGDVPTQEQVRKMLGQVPTYAKEGWSKAGNWANTYSQFRSQQ